MARYKVLKSVAHSVGHSFTSLMNYRRDDYVMGHLLRRARKVHAETFTLDLLSGKASPSSLLTREVREAADSYAKWFPTLVESHQTALDYIMSATMTITFDLGVHRPARYAPTCIESPYVCRVIIEDDRGKAWSAEISDWWFPEPRIRESVRRIVRERLGQLIRSVWRRLTTRLAAA